MDRGVKIAIFVASIAALSLGLIWDQVLSSARAVLPDKPDVDILGPERMDAIVGPQSVPRVEFPQRIDPSPAQEPSPQPESQPPAPGPEGPESGFTEYLIVDNDSWWRITEKVWGKDRAPYYAQIEAANPDVKKLIPGKTVKIPKFKKS